ncbi:MAG: UBP-type zinc finger domain-containing protein [Vulcanimicrobiaceae bacterium]
MTKQIKGIDPDVRPSGTGCVECESEQGWWFHLRRCAQCGHIGCCDSSPSKHATAHFDATEHPIIASFEPGEAWFYRYETGDAVEAQHLAEPRWHPRDQPIPGPHGRVPEDWQSRLN